MRLTVFGYQLLHIDLDVTIGPEAESEFEEYQDAGTVASTPVTAGEVPWGDVDALHAYAPAEGDEGRRKAPRIQTEQRRLGF